MLFGRIPLPVHAEPPTRFARRLRARHVHVEHGSDYVQMTRRWPGLVARIYDELSASRMPADLLTRVHAPIGLDIGAVTPQEIAVSILAELIAVKHGKVQSPSMKWLPPALKSHGSTLSEP